MRFGPAGPALAEAFRNASGVIPFLASRGALTWLSSPAGPGLERYFEAAAPQPGAEEAGRRLRTIAAEIESASVRVGESPADLNPYITDLDSVALLARFHAHKIVAAHSLMLFYESGDIAALRHAAWNAAAASVAWDRLSRVGGKRPGLLFGPAAQRHCLGAMQLVQRDLSLLEQVDATFQRYGLYDAALVFGANQDGIAGVLENFPVRRPQGRFRVLHPSAFYSPERGFGWRNADSVRPAGGTALRGSSGTVLAVDMPDGDYRVTSIVTNQPELASGSFHVRAGPAVITYAAGETGEKSMHATVTGGVLDLTFAPDPGSDWLITGLVIARRAPHFGWLPPRAVQAGAATSLAITITAPDGVREASLACVGPEGEVVRLPLVADSPQYRASVEWPRRWKGKQVRCSCSAVDRRGTAARFPGTSDLQIEVR